MGQWASIIILVLIAAAVAAVVISAIRNRIKGKPSCSCGTGCAGCPMKGTCHGEEANK